MSQRYEVLFVLRPDLGEAGVSDQLERTRQILAQQGATGVEIQDWGVRDLAYRIETHRRGRYMLVEYEGAPAAVAELERNLKLSDQVLRFMSVRQTNGGHRHPPPADSEPARAPVVNEGRDDDDVSDGDEGEE